MGFAFGLLLAAMIGCYEKEARRKNGCSQVRIASPKDAARASSRHMEGRAIQYTTTQNGQGWEFRPSGAFVGALVGSWTAGAGLFVYLACRTESFFRVIFLAVAGLLVGGVVWAWRTRHTVLTVRPGGRVCYGLRELCSAGAVRAVRIADARSGESGDCEVCLELDGGKLVYLPSTSLYFTGCFKMRAHARPFAAELATALGVGVTQSA